jgi:hypothetical protein
MDELWEHAWSNGYLRGTVMGVVVALACVELTDDQTARVMEGLFDSTAKVYPREDVAAQFTSCLDAAAEWSTLRPHHDRITAALERIHHKLNERNDR